MCSSDATISHFNIPRGHSGVAILCSYKLYDKITKLKVGNEQIIALELDFGQTFCFINVYMPTNKNITIVKVLLGVSSEQLDSHCYLKKGQDKSKKVYCWNKLSQEQFYQHVTLKLTQCNSESTEMCVKSITSCLKSAAEKSIPQKL